MISATACTTSRQAVSEKVHTARVQLRDSSLAEKVVVAVHDTIVETTTIHVQTNESGDTLKVAQVTDRTRTVARDRAREVQERVVVRTDTVYVEKRDSVFVRAPDQVGGDGRKPPFVSALKWIFWILISLVVLVFTLKFWRI